MKKQDLLIIEKRLLMLLNGVPLQIRMMLANTYNSAISNCADSEEACGEELFETMEELLSEHGTTQT